MSSMSRERASVGFSPIRWNGARKIPNFMPLWAMVASMLPCRPMINQTIRVGFVGAGANTRKHHIPKLRAQPGVELVAVANRTKESSERVAREFGIPRVYDDWRNLVRAPDVDAVCIGTWPYVHCAITLAALDAGKHVLCEARMAMDAAEARRMLDGARRAPHLITQLVPAPNTLEVDATLQRLVAEGYVGEVLAVEIRAIQGRFVDPAEALHWRQDATVSGLNVMSMGIWYEALTRWLPPASRVMAVTKTAVPGRRGDRERREIPIPAERRIGWRVEEEFVSALRGHEKITRTTFEDGVRYMEFTDAVARSAASGQAIDVTEL